MDLESIARELRMVAGRERLSPSELDRVRHLMVELKRLGMSNPEIVEVTGGRWSESTVKGYTRGVHAIDSEPWKSTASLLSEMLSRNLTLAEVSQAMATASELEAMGTSLDNVVSFMQELKQKKVSLEQLAEAISLNAELERIGASASEIAGFIRGLEHENIDTPTFLLLFRDWHRAGLTATDAQSALKYKEQLEGAGFDIEALPQIAEAAGKLGSPPEVLEAVAKYSSLGDLDEELKSKREELHTLATEMESRSRQLDIATKKMEGVRKETADLRKALATYRRLEATGFDEKSLGELAKLIEKQGTPRKVLTALNHFTDLSKIKATAEDLENKVKQRKAMVKSLEDEHSHLKELIELCKALLKRSFGLRSLSLINATAWRYGEPVEILKAIEAYGKLTEIEKKISQANTELVETEGKIQRLKEVETEYQARNRAILDQFEALNTKAIEVGQELGVVLEQTKKGTKARDILTLLQNPMTAGYEDYATLVLLLAKSIRIWVNGNKSKFSLSYRIDEGLEALAKNLGGS